MADPARDSLPPAWMAAAPPWSRRLAEGLAHANLHVGVVAVALMSATSLMLGMPPEPALLGLGFVATVLVYQVEHWAPWAPEDAINHPARRAWWAARPGWRLGWLVGLGAVAAGLLATLRGPVLLLSIALGGAVLLYVVPLLPGRRRLKASRWAKPLVVSLAWALGAVLVPVVHAGVEVTGGVLALIAYRAALVWPNVLLADWPDRAGDTRAGLRTLASTLPPPRLRRCAAAPLVAALGGGAIAVTAGLAPLLLAVDLIGYGLMLLVVLGPWPQAGWFYPLGLDLLVAWPLIPAVGSLLT